MSYSMVLQDLLKRVLFGRGGFGEAWHSLREKLLLIYEEALSSNCTQLVQLIEVVVCFVLVFKDLSPWMAFVLALTI